MLNEIQKSALVFLDRAKFYKFKDFSINYDIKSIDFG